MLEKLRSHLTYANVMATIATFLALGGGAYALTIPANSIGTKQLKKKAVTRAKLAPNAVTSDKVANGRLTAADFKSGELPRGTPGAKGDPGDPGAPGAKGDPGAPGANGLDGTAVAYAHVLANGTLDTTRSKNVTGAKKHPLVAQGAYCLYGNLEAKNAVATVDGSVSQSHTIFVQLEGLDPTCGTTPSGAPLKATVVTRVSNTQAASDAAFYIVFN